MNPNLIFVPVIAIVLLTFAVGILMLKFKFKAVEEDGLNPKHFLLNKGAKLPDYLAKATNHYANLFEAPVLFYVVCLTIYAVNKTDNSYLVLAWLYAGLRYAHAFIHMTYNGLKHRMLVFLAGMAILAALWTRLAIQLIAF
ncbi:MAG: MAPEG family protein [Methylovulum sp.]|nr:MAPEG family protein [Methylovulum sp.]